MLEAQYAERDRSIEVKCIKCSTRLARLQVKSMFQLGVYLCLACFEKLDKPFKDKEK